jgi:hypothetical protein
MDTGLTCYENLIKTAVSQPQRALRSAQPAAAINCTIKNFILQLQQSIKQYKRN